MTWREFEAQIPGEAALVALVGSHAYGTERPDSDRDYRGVYVAPTVRLFTMDPLLETFDRKDPDVTLHELGKFVSLAAAANPTILETLWADSYEATGTGAKLRENRHLFLSAKVFKTYTGYATQQLAKARRGTGGSRGVGHFKREKFYLHTYRLMLAGIHCLETGDLQVRVDDPEALWAKASQPLEKIQADFLGLEHRIRKAYAMTELPAEPSRAAINLLLIEIRRAHLLT